MTTFTAISWNSPNFAGMISGSFSSPMQSLTPEGPSSLPPGVTWGNDVLLEPECFSACGWQPSWSLPERDRRNLTTTRRTTDRRVRAVPTIMPRIGEMGSSPSDAATERQADENHMLGSWGLSCQVDDSRPPVILNYMALFTDIFKTNSPNLHYIALVGLLSSQEQQDGLRDYVWGR